MFLHHQRRLDSETRSLYNLKNEMHSLIVLQFISLGVAANSFRAGSFVWLSFAIASFTCLLSALPYAEFASRVPLAGSAYTFAYTSLGEGEDDRSFTDLAFVALFTFSACSVSSL